MQLTVSRERPYCLKTKKHLLPDNGIQASEELKKEKKKAKKKKERYN